jgi:hypothetical protein
MWCNWGVDVAGGQCVCTDVLIDQGHTFRSYLRSRIVVWLVVVVAGGSSCLCVSGMLRPKHYQGNNS